MKTFLQQHRWSVLLVVVGLVICILILTINFWRTLLICAVVGVCLLFGTLMDKGGWDTVKEFWDKILPKR